jgi:hypothetical protein
MNLHSGPESNPESSVNRPLPRSSYETKQEVSHTHTRARARTSKIYVLTVKLQRLSVRQQDLHF